MNITFLIGNGFDLNIGLKTTYTDFLKDYTKNTETDSDLIKCFKKDILRDAKMWSNAEKAFGDATKAFKELGYTAEDFCLCHEDFCVKLAAYLLSEEQRLNYSSLNDTISKGFAKGVCSYKKGFRETETGVITTSENTFSGGLTFNFVSLNYTAVLDLCYKAVRTNPSLLVKRNFRGGMYENRLGNIIHVHGTVHRDMVLGVNDISQIKEPTLFDGYDEEYINEMIKPKTNEINEENSDKKAFELLKTSDLIYIYGMSTGETDKLWWERICELMKQKPNLHLIIHKFDAPEDGLIRRTFRLFTNEERKAFTNYSELGDTQRSEIETRIHIDKTNIFVDLKELVKNPANQKQSEKVLTTVS